MIAPHIANWALNRSKAGEARVAAVVATQLTTVTDKKRKDKQRKQHDEPAVLETKGGGQAMPAQPTPLEQAQAREWEANQQFERDERTRKYDEQKRADDKLAADNAWSSGKNSAFNNALSSGKSKLQSLGLEAGDQYGAYDEFINRLTGNNASLQTGADYSTAFAPTLIDEILGSSRTSQRNKYKTAFNSEVDPYYAEDRFNSTSDDAILNSILDAQYNDAMGSLTASRDRGQTSNIVYDRALKDLATGRATANSDLQGIGRGILESITGDVNKRRQGSLDKAAEWDFGGEYDPSREGQRIRTYADERGQGLEGDIRGAVGGREFFDVNSLLGKATAKAGNQTTPATTGGSALYDTFQNEAERNNTNVRQNEGTF